MLCRADSIGVFQVESRAQVGTLPRLRPRRFYDLVIEVALIRPGPIQGGAVHPYIRRATGREPVTYLHPTLEPVLERTKGVPLFQEQLMQIAMAVGDCTGDDADLLRRAMGSKRGVEKIERLRDKLYAGMATNGITGDAGRRDLQPDRGVRELRVRREPRDQLRAAGLCGVWLKLHYPAAFLAGLLRAQPMGFYSPQSLVADARRHGVTVLRPDIVGPASTPGSSRCWSAVAADRPTGHAGCLERTQPAVGPFDRDCPDLTPTHRRDGNFAVRLGLHRSAGRRSGAGRADRRRTRPRAVPRPQRRHPPNRDDRAQAEALATAGAFDCFGLSRRQALWHAGYTDTPDTLPGSAIDAAPPTLPGMSPVEPTMADLWATKISPDDHPIGHLRPVLDRHEIVRSPIWCSRRRSPDQGRPAWSPTDSGPARPAG